MKPYIGIISRNSKSDSNKDILIAYYDTIKAIYKSGGIPLIIPILY